MDWIANSGFNENTTDIIPNGQKYPVSYNDLWCNILKPKVHYNIIMMSDKTLKELAESNETVDFRYEAVPVKLPRKLKKAWKNKSSWAVNLMAKRYPSYLYKNCHIVTFECDYGKCVYEVVNEEGHRL